MASYAKSIDSNHLVEAGLEGFYGHSDTQKNPNFQVGTDFIANNQIPEIDFATVHSYPDQWYLSKKLSHFFCVRLIRRKLFFLWKMFSINQLLVKNIFRKDIH